MVGRQRTGCEWQARDLEAVNLEYGLYLLQSMQRQDLCPSFAPHPLSISEEQCIMGFYYFPEIAKLCVLAKFLVLFLFFKLCLKLPLKFFQT